MTWTSDLDSCFRIPWIEIAYSLRVVTSVDGEVTCYRCTLQLLECFITSLSLTRGHQVDSRGRFTVFDRSRANSFIATCKSLDS